MEYETQQIFIEDSEDRDSSASNKEAKGNITKEYLNIFKRRWLLFLALSIATIVPAYLWSRKEPPLYGSSFDMLVEPVTNQELLTDPSVLARISTNTNSNIFGVDYPTIIKLLRSRGVLEKVAEKVSQKFPEYTPEVILQSFERNLSIQRASIGKSRFDVSKVIVVGYRGPQARLVTEVLDTLMEEYLLYSQNEKEKNIDSGKEFINNQIPQIRSRINQLQNRQKNIQQQYNLILPQEKGQTLFGQSTNNQQALQDVQVQMQELTVLSNNLQQSLGFSPQEAAVASVLNQDPERQSLLNQLQQIESNLALELAVSTANHPNAQNLIEQKENIENLLEQETARILQENNISRSSITNPRVFTFQNTNRLASIQNLIDTQNQLDTLNTRFQSLSINQAQTVQNLNEMPQIIKEYNDLERQIQLDTNILNQLTTQREALTVDVASKQIPWEILSPPKVPEFLSSPSNTKLAIGGGLGLLFAGLTSVWVDKRRNIFYQPSDVEYAFGLPVLGKVAVGSKNKRIFDFDQDSFFEDLSDDISSGSISSELLSSSSFSSAGAATPGNISGKSSFDSRQADSASEQGEITSFSKKNFAEIYANLYFKLPHSEEKKQVVISSLNPADGQANVCANLGKVAADIHEKVLLIDGNIIQEEIPMYFDDTVPKGLAQLLQPTFIGEARSTQTGTVHNLSILTAARKNADLPSNLSSEETQSAIESVAKDHTLILYNTSYFLEAHDLSLLADSTQGIVMVVKLKQTPKSSLIEAVERIKHYKLNFLGFIVTE